MQVFKKSLIPEVVTFCPDTHRDERGTFTELFNVNTTSVDGHALFPDGVKQVSRSVSKCNVFRGFHFQDYQPMAKIMRVVKGKAFVFSMDIRPNSPTFGMIEMDYVSDFNRLMVYAPAWCARAFHTLEDNTTVEYLHSAPHNPDSARTILYRTVPEIDGYLVEDMIVSDKDKSKGFALYEWQDYALQHGIFCQKGLYNVLDFGVSL